MLCLATQVLPEVIGVQTTTGQHHPPLDTHQAGAVQTIDNPCICAGVIAENLKQALEQVFTVVQPERVVTEMITKRTVVVGSVHKEVGSRHPPTGYQVGLSTEQGHAFWDLVWVQRCT